MSRTESGFTLIEVMIALAIFAVMAGAIAMANSQNLTAAYMIEEQTHGRWVNENVLARLRLSAAPDLGTQEKKVDFNGQEWTVEIEVEESSLFNELAAIDPRAESIAQQLSAKTRYVRLRAFPPESETAADVLYAMVGDP